MNKDDTIKPQTEEKKRRGQRHTSKNKIRKTRPEFLRPAGGARMTQENQRKADT